MIHGMIGLNQSLFHAVQLFICSSVHLLYARCPFDTMFSDYLLSPNDSTFSLDAVKPTCWGLCGATCCENCDDLYGDLVVTSY